LVLGGVAAAVAASGWAWASEGDARMAVALALAAVVFASILGFVMVAAAAGAGPAKLATMVFAAGVVRMILSLSVGLALFMILGPEGRSFWTAFLVASLLSLVAETAWGMSTLKRMTAVPRGSPVGRGAVE